MSGLSRYVTELWQGQTSGLWSRLLGLLLLLPSYAYGVVMRLRAWCYAHGICRVQRLPRPVISVGNLTVGGTGKTPVTAWIARHLMQQGLKVAVLSRGYGGSWEGRVAIVSDGRKLLLTAEQCGDEPYLLASTIPGLLVVIGSDRHKAGLLAMEHLAPDVFLLDDGFQHLRLHRDLNILLLDCHHPLGNGHVLPAGPLREPQAAAKRAGLLIYTRCTASQGPGWKAELDIPCVTARYRLSSFERLDTGATVDVMQLAAQRVLAFAGIAKPDSFFSALQEAGITPCATIALADHEPFGPAVVDQINATAQRAAAQVLVTTEKDGVKLRGMTFGGGVPLVTARLALEFCGEGAIDGALRSVLRPSSHDVLVTVG